MSLSKIEYAKKLIKFNKSVESSEILKKIIYESSDFSQRKAALEILLFDIELKKEKLVWDRIDPLIRLAEEHNFISVDKLNSVKYMKNNEVVSRKIEIVPTEKFEEIYNFFKIDFINKNLEQKPHRDLLEIDFQFAKKTAHDQNIEVPFESWNDLRNSIQKEAYASVFSKSISLELLEDNVDQLNEILEEKLNSQDKIFYYFLDDLESDIYLILMATYIGFKNKLIDRMLDAYRINYMPCGWKGEYPEGELCVTNGMLNFK